MLIKQRVLSIAVVASLLMMPGAANARFRSNNDGFKLNNSNPGQDSSVSSPSSITLNFTKAINASQSDMSVTDTTYGTPVQIGRIQFKPAGFSASLPHLNPGRYRVRWESECQHCRYMHKDNGSFYFTVK